MWYVSIVIKKFCFNLLGIWTEFWADGAGPNRKTYRVPHAQRLRQRPYLRGREVSIFLTVLSEKKSDEQCCWSGIRCLFDPWMRGPGSWIQDEQPNSYFWELKQTWIKILKFFDADPGSGMEKNSDPGWNEQIQIFVDSTFVVIFSTRKLTSTY